MITLLSSLLPFLFVLGVLVFVHELGHFLVARWHGVRVITFSLGFGPKLVKYTRGDTEYCVSVVPLGGYVKLAGETVDEARTGQPDEFLSKSKWVRFQVYIAGPVMNIMLAIVVLAGVLSRGADVPLYEQAPAVIGGITPGSAAEAGGLRVGDRIVTVNGVDVPSWEALNMAVLPKAGRELVVGAVRGGQPVGLRLTPRASGKYEMGDLGAKPVYRPQIKDVSPRMPAESAGLQRGDVILSINGEADLSQEEVIKRISQSAGQPIVMRLERQGESREISLTPQGAAGAGRIGVTISAFETRRIDPSLGQAVTMSLQQNWDSTVLIGKTLRGLFTRDTPVRQLMGPVAIAEMSGNAAEIGWIAIFNLMAMISLNLGLLNLVPVPVLDGGHIAILAIEGLARRDLSIRVKERMLMAGAALIVLLMVTVIFNDISRILR